MSLSQWRADRRADETAAAERARLDRESAARMATEREAALAGAQLQAMQMRLEHQEKQDQAAADRRAARWTALRERIGEHGFALVVIVTPMVLAWSAIAVYGIKVYGPHGVVLPLFAEAAFIWFTLAIPRAQREQRPTFWLWVGWALTGMVTAVFAALHGLTMDGGSWDKAVLMAIVAVGGAVVHQLINAGPRVSRVERRRARAEARIVRVAEDRVTAMRLAAARQAVGDLDAEGNVRLVHSPGLVTLDRRGLRRRPVLTEAITAAEPAAETSETEGTDELMLAYRDLLRGAVPLAEDLHETPAQGVSGVTAAGQDGSAAGEGGVVTAEGEEPTPGETDLAGWVRRAELAIAAGDLTVTDPQRRYRAVLGCRTRMAGAVQRALLARAGQPTTKRRRGGAT